MIYSKSIQSKVFKRIAISWVVIAILFGVSGFVLGSYNTTNKQLMYGDTEIIDKEVSFSWSNADMLKFQILPIDLDEHLQEYIYCLSYSYNIDYSFVLGLMDVESNFTENAVSETGDYGLFQINEINHKELKETLDLDDISDPYQNSMAGIFILRKLFEEYHDPQKVLMAYNMGESGAATLWDKGIYTSPFSEKVIKKSMEYKKLLEGSK